MTERSNDLDWANFIEENKVRFIETFSSLYDEITDEEAPDKQVGDDENNEEKNEGGNFFALKELMKLQYQMLTSKDKCFKSMQEHFCNDKNRLYQVMQLMEFEDDSLVFECILHLSIFLRPGRNIKPEIEKVLSSNG